MATSTSQRKVYMGFLGCRLNQAEIEQMGREFAARGDVITSRVADADLVVINTCAVTRQAGRKSRQMLLGAFRANPDAQIVATGCYAQIAPDSVSALPGVSDVIGTFDKDNLVPLVSSDDPGPMFDQEPILRDPLPPGTLGRTRAFVKVQDGCDNACTFCVTTLARGKGRSRPMDMIIEEINALVAVGYQEAILTGVHLGSYGHDLDETRSLFGLVKAILHHTSVSRLRLSSLEPWDISPEFFSLWEDSRLGAHLHLPLQSGCDATLRRMARKTTQRDFADLVEAARAAILHLNLTTDLIVGFPGETDQEFSETLAFVEAMNFARLHVFPYSLRPGTAAARLRDQIADSVKTERKHILFALSSKNWRSFQSASIGEIHAVLWESARGAGPDGIRWSGHTSNYLRVETATKVNLANILTSARITRLNEQGLWARLLETA